MTNVFSKKKYQDDDKDGLPDEYERNIGLHNNKNKHINVGGNLAVKNGNISIPHQYLNGIRRKSDHPLKVGEMKPIKLSVDMKSPVIKSKMKKISCPKAEIGDINFPKHTMDDIGIQKFLDKLKRKKVN